MDVYSQKTARDAAVTHKSQRKLGMNTPSNEPEKRVDALQSNDLNIQIGRERPAEKQPTIYSVTMDNLQAVRQEIVHEMQKGLAKLTTIQARSMVEDKMEELDAIDVVLTILVAKAESRESHDA